MKLKMNEPILILFVFELIYLSFKDMWCSIIALIHLIDHHLFTLFED